MKILLIAGGWSSEREVSLNGARGMAEALRALGHSVTFFDLLTEFDQLLPQAREHDFALINLHGAPGEDGLVQAMLDQRAEARARKDWTTADAIRDTLTNLGLTIEDTPTGAHWSLS